MYKFQTVEKETLAWLAGIFQGEAYFSIDNRGPSDSNYTPADTDYVPSPGVLTVKLEMVEKDLMEYIGDLLELNVIEVKRRTSANKVVYKIFLSSRHKTEVFLRAIYPYVIGQLKRSAIKELLDVCDQYNNWYASGGPSKAAAVAARVKARKAKQALDSEKNSTKSTKKSRKKKSK
jgi:hypothetical protein